MTAKDKPHTLWVGAEKGDDLFVATSDSPQVYTVKKFSIEHIARKPIDYRDKTIVKAKQADLQSVDHRRGHATRPRSRRRTASGPRPRAPPTTRR